VCVCLSVRVNGLKNARKNAGATKHR